MRSRTVMAIALLPAVYALLTVACGSDALLAPDGPTLPLTLENLTGRWEQQALIYEKMGLRTGVLADTVTVTEAERKIYELNLEGDNMVRRVQPNPGTGIIQIEPHALIWNIGENEYFGATVTANRLYLADALEVPYRFPGDSEDSDAAKVHVLERVAVP